MSILKVIRCFVLIVLVVFSGFRAGQDQDSRETSTGVKVEVVSVQQTSFHETIRGIGTLRARETVEITPEMSEVIENIMDQHDIPAFTRYSMIEGKDADGKHYGDKVFPGSITMVQALVSDEHLTMS